MRKFIFLIGNEDEFESVEELKNAYLNAGDARSSRWTPAVFEVELSEACRVSGYDSLPEIATLIGRAEAFTHNWCEDGTLSTLLES